MISELALLLYKLNCVQVGDFLLTSGMRSPIYVDLRRIPSHPEVFERITDLCINKIREIKADLVCGIATGGIPLATLMAYKLKMPLIYVRKGERGHGTKRLVEGDYNPGATALVVDDVSTTGGSILRAVRVLREEGIRVYDAFVVVDRGQGARECLAKEGVMLHFLARLMDIVEFLFSEGLINRHYYESIKEYLRGCRSRV